MTDTPDWGWGRVPILGDLCGTSRTLPGGVRVTSTKTGPVDNGNLGLDSVGSLSLEREWTRHRNSFTLGETRSQKNRYFTSVIMEDRRSLNYFILCSSHVVSGSCIIHEFCMVDDDGDNESVKVMGDERGRCRYAPCSLELVVL